MEIPIEIQTNQCQVFEDINEFKKLKMIEYAENMNRSFKHDAFIKYAEIFNMNISVVDNLDVDFDVCIFVYEECSSEFKNSIIKSDKKFIALMSKEYNDYEKYKHINSMCFPLYCSKIHMVFEELLNPEEYLPYSQSLSQKFKGHILIAEDNEANQELIKILLMKYGLTFDLAENGQEALELYKTNKYDLILMDEQMPVMNGNEAVEKILEYEESNGLSHTPVSALTANVIKGAKERGLLSGFDAFLGKPIVLKDLERVFMSYLKFDLPIQKLDSQTQDNCKKEIVGLNAKKLSEELMLSDDELIILLSLFIKKMDKTIPNLQKFIKCKDYKKIALSAHSIKGSSGNFRIESLQHLASEMEAMAKKENKEYDYEGVFQKIKEIIESIKIN
jgi:CheY-like chemotaxis protein